MPSSTAYATHVCRDDNQYNLQHNQLHPLLQSLAIGLPAQFETTGQDTKQLQPRSSSKCTPSSLQQSQKSHGVPPSTAQSAVHSQAAAALAQALRQDPALLLDSSSAQQLLVSLAAKQQHEQLHTRQLSGLTTSRQQVPAATLPFAGHPGSNSSSSSTKVAPFMQSTQQATRPVTPHVTKPYRVKVVKQPLQQSGSCNPAAIAGKSGSGSMLQQQAKHPGQQRPTSADSRRALDAACASNSILQYSAGAAQRPATAATIRPGSAAANKLLRSLDAGVVCACSRPGSAAASAADSRIGRKPGLRHQQQQQLSHVVEPVQDHVERDAGQVDSSSQAASCSGQQGSAAVVADTALQDKELQREQQSIGMDYDSRPSTAYLRALLLSRSGADAAVAERLAFYQHINSSNDATEGLDIVQEEQEQEEPGGLHTY